MPLSIGVERFLRIIFMKYYCWQQLEAAKGDEINSASKPESSVQLDLSSGKVMMLLYKVYHNFNLIMVIQSKKKLYYGQNLGVFAWDESLIT